MLCAFGIVGIIMGSLLSGSLIIDSDLNIIGFNRDMETLFPKIRTGEKCYSLLVAGTKPCAACPIIASDVHRCSKADICPYSDINEIHLTEQRTLYMLSFKASDAKHEVNLETTSEKRYIQGVINSLSGDIKDIYEIDVKTRTI